MKKSQVTIFIVFGIFVLIVIGLFFVVRERVADLNKEKIDPEVEPIYNFVRDCIKETGSEAILGVSEKGGYFFSPEYATESGVPYYVDKGANYMPTKEKVEEEISLYIHELLFLCVKNFIYYSDYEIAHEDDIVVDTQIFENKVVIDSVYPISISKGEKSYFFKDFKGIEIYARLGLVYDVAEQITLEQVKATKDICFSCLIDLAEENDLYIRMMDYDEETVLFIIEDKNSLINEEVLSFIFANKYETSF